MQGIEIPTLDEALVNRTTICNSIHLLTQLHSHYKVDTVSITRDESGKAVISFVVTDLGE